MAPAEIQQKSCKGPTGIRTNTACPATASTIFAMSTDDMHQLAEHLYCRYKTHGDARRFLVGVAGIPGSGKSTLAYPLTDAINALAKAAGEPEVAVCVGGDGWHYSQDELRKMEVCGF